MTINSTINVLPPPEVMSTINSPLQTVTGVMTQVSVTVTGEMSAQVIFIPPPAFLARVVSLEALRPILINQDVTAGDLETVTMPGDNPNRIGMVQQIDSTDGDRVYYPNFTTTPDGRSAIFISVLTATQNKILIWPRPLEF